MAAPKANERREPVFDGTSASDSGPERARQIHQEHLERAMADVIAAKDVMQQSLFRDEDPLLNAVARMERRMFAATIIATTSLVAALIAMAIVLLR